MGCLRITNQLVPHLLMHLPTCFSLSAISHAYKAPYTQAPRILGKIFSLQLNKAMWKEDPSSFMKGFDLYVQFLIFLFLKYRT